MLVVWSAGATFLIGWIWISVGRLDATQTKAHASREDTSAHPDRLAHVTSALIRLRSAQKM